MEFWSLKSKTILIVDDFAEMRSMVRNLLFSFGARDTHDARNGKEAIQHLEKRLFDIVLCDYALGAGKDGQQILEEAKHRNLLSYSSIFIMITAESTTQMVMGAMEYSPDDYLTKPFTKAVLRLRLEKLMQRKDNLQDISKCIQNKDYVHALTLCDKNLATKPKNSFELNKLRGELLCNLGDYAAAGTLYEGVLAKRAIPWAALGLGITHFHQQHYEQAEDIFQGLIDTNHSFTMAYDWLAETMKRLGNTDKSQELLMEATKKSPKAILRQRKLAEISFHNKDYGTSEQAYRQTIKIGKNSCYKSPRDYTGLAKTFMQRDAPKEALNIVADIGREFTDNKEARLQAKLMEGWIFKETGEEKYSQQAVDEALEIFTGQPENVPSDIAMDLARACFALGKKEQGNELVKHVVRNHHDDENTLEQARQLYHEADMTEEGENIIATARREVIDINNQGVQLAREGKIEQSIELFVKAANGMPENSVVNLNAAQSLIMQMQKVAKSKKLLLLTWQYLERVGELDATNSKYQKLMKIYQQLAAR